MITLTIPGLRLINSSNAREHWAIRKKRATRERTAVALSLRPKISQAPLPIHVCITRISPRFLDSHDNLPISAKHCADAVAEIYGIKDNDPRISFEYAQQKSKPGVYGVMIQIETRTA